MNSFNHYAYGALGEWLYKHVAGIDIDVQNPGYKHVILAPHPGGELTKASAELKSMYGLIKSAWKLDQSQFNYEVTIPANTTATVTLPHAELTKITLNNLPLSGSKLFKAEQKGDETIVQLGSGSYRFAYASDQFLSQKQ
jgi:alpha-L-rhamnosidase